MMKSLRARLVISHLLPLLIIVPLMGVALIYLIETRVILPGLLRTLQGDAALIAQITNDNAALWNDPVYAQVKLAQVSARLPERVMLFNGQGQLLASSDPNDLQNLNRFLRGNDAMDQALQGKIVQRVYYNQQLQGEALEVWEPVLAADGSEIGIIRITYPFAAISADFVQSRILIAAILLVGLLFGGALGFTLAFNIETPLRRATQAVYGLARGERHELLEESGPLELRRLAGAVNSLVQRLHELEESRKRLLANLVHELGRPLGALRSAVQALQKGAVKDPDLSGELLSGMDNELSRLQSLLGDLTHLYDQVQGTLELDLTTVHLDSWLSEIATPWKAAAQEKGLEWTSAVERDLPDLRIDAVRLGQALGNLLSNAVKFTPPGGKVGLAAGCDAVQVWLSVTDNGPGIPAEEQEKVFTPFYRGSQGKRFAEGMGLGLSISRDLVAAHGGRLELESQPGQGSTFKILLPLPESSR